MKRIIWAGLMANLVVISLIINVISIPLLTPLNNSYTDTRTPTFAWGGFGKTYELLIDDSPDFSFPLVKKIVTGNSYTLENELDFGTYYWKVQSGCIGSVVRKYTIVSKVALRRMENEVRNTGNVEIILRKISDRVTGQIILDVNQSTEIGDESIEAEQV